MPQTVSEQHPLQEYLNGLDTLLGQLTELRWSIARKILEDRDASNDSTPTIRCRRCEQFTPLRSTTNRCRHCDGDAYDLVGRTA